MYIISSKHIACKHIHGSNRSFRSQNLCDDVEVDQAARQSILK